MSTPLPSPHVFDATEANFQTEVLDASFQQAVLVDLWATWCGPCKTLGPLLEKVVDSFNGSLRLAKVDVDKEQALAASFGVRSIPTVVLIREGQLVDAFTGALPEGQIREFLLRHVQPAEAAPEADAAPAAPPEEPEQAIARLQQEIAAAPDRAELKLDLAVAQMQAGNAEGAEALLDALPANLASDDRARRLRGELEFASALKDAPPLEELEARVARDPADFEARDLLGVRLLINGQAAAALDQFIEILRANRHWNDDQARKRLVAAFQVIGDEDLVGTYRRRMSSLLF
ncbi:MAG: thioredoxin [Xanthomonadales bacterium]|nr:thioredoxin [Xanthomonadales bacterium]